MEDKLEMLIESYGLENLLEIHDVRQEFVLRFLIDEGFLNLEDYFPDLTTTEEDDLC